MYGETNRTRIGSRRHERSPPAQSGVQLHRGFSTVAPELFDAAGGIDHAGHGGHRQSVILAVIAQPGFDEMGQREIAHLPAALSLVMDHLHEWHRRDAPARLARAKAPVKFLGVQKK